MIRLIKVLIVKFFLNIFSVIIRLYGHTLHQYREKSYFTTDTYMYNMELSIVLPLLLNWRNVGELLGKPLPNPSEKSRRDIVY